MPLFGTLSDIEFTHDINALEHTNSYSTVLGLTLVADFSLIDTKTYEITSAFTAMGEGQDTKLVNDADVRVAQPPAGGAQKCPRGLGGRMSLANWPALARHTLRAGWTGAT